jgi:hypothetical protein
METIKVKAHSETESIDLKKADELDIEKILPDNQPRITSYITFTSKEGNQKTDELKGKSYPNLIDYENYKINNNNHYEIEVQYETLNPSIYDNIFHSSNLE